jgi:hypothetical protein
MRFFIQSFILWWVSLTSFSTQSWAGVYSFGGGCASLGDWTRQALTQTDNLMGIVERLKNNPDCAGIESIVPKIKMAQAYLNAPDEERNRQSRLESLPGEINSLREFLIGTPDLKSQVIRVLSAKTLEQASITASSTMATGATPLAVAKGMQDMAVRLDRSAQYGLEILDSVFNVLPNFDKCVMGAPDQGVALVSTFVKLTALTCGIENLLKFYVS